GLKACTTPGLILSVSGRKRIALIRRIFVMVESLFPGRPEESKRRGNAVKFQSDEQTHNCWLHWIYLCSGDVSAGAVSGGAETARRSARHDTGGRTGRRAEAG